MKIGSAVRPGRVPEKKKDRTGQDRTGQDSQKKSQGGNISPIWGKANSVPIKTKICMVGRLPDVITYAKFHVKIFWGYDFTGRQISHFPIDKCKKTFCFITTCKVHR